MLLPDHDRPDHGESGSGPSDQARFLEAILSHSTDMIVVSDQVGIVRWASQSVTATLGYPAADLIGRNVLEFVHPQEAARTADSLMTTTQHKGVAEPVEVRFKTVGGEWLVCEVVGSNRLDHPDIRGMVWNGRDVTQRLAIQREFRNLFEKNPIATFLSRSDAPGVIANDAFVELTGYSREELLSIDPTKLLAEPDRYLKTQRRVMARQDHGNTLRGDAFFLRKDGTRFIAAVSASTTRDRSGRRAFITTVHDVTEWREAVQQNADSEARIATAEAERSRAELEARLEQAMRLESVGRLAAGLAHDFNNLVGVIQNYALVLGRNPGLDDVAKSDVQAIVTAAESAARLANSLLQFGSVSQEPARRIDLREVVTDLLPLLNSTLLPTQSLVTTMSDQPLQLEMNRGQAEQLVMNLVLNARDASRNDGIIELDLQLDVSSYRGPGGGAVVSLGIHDYGSGMTDDVRKRAFDPFFTTKPTGMGTGLGLAVVHGIVKNCSGDITLESKPGRGTTVCVRIPTAVG